MSPEAAPAQSQGCLFQTAPDAATAFCETFDRPFSNEGTRSGALDGVVWGVSRATSNDNPPQGLLYNWSATQLNLCGKAVQVLPPNDVQICGGQLVESMNDNGNTDMLAMYPRQPFDIAGRTGTVVFDVGDDSQGGHAAWPAFVYTDQPVPAPGPSDGAPSVADYPANSFGLTLAGICPNESGCGGNVPTQPSPTCVTVDSMVVTTNYALSNVPFTRMGCILQPTQYGQLNHFEVRLSQNQVQVFGSDAGQTGVRLIAQANNVPMPLTRGLIWIEHVQYNAGKSDTQRIHSFAWDNVGFDGPILPRDLGFDVPDNTAPGRPTELEGLPTQNLGYSIPAGRSLNVQVENVSDPTQAKAALLELNYLPRNPQTLTYSVNGNPTQSAPWRFAVSRDTVFSSQTIALPVQLSQLRVGTNTFTLSTSDGDGVTVANIDLILVGAGAQGVTGTRTSAGGSVTPVPVGPAPAAPAPAPTSAVAPAADVTQPYAPDSGPDMSTHDSGESRQDSGEPAPRDSQEHGDNGGD
jgi:hypothetical protein